MQNLSALKYTRAHPESTELLCVAELGLYPEYRGDTGKDFNWGAVRVDMFRIQNIRDLSKQRAGSKAFPR